MCELGCWALSLTSAHIGPRTRPQEQDQTAVCRRTLHTAVCTCRNTKVILFGAKLVVIRGRPGKPNQRKGQNEKFMNFAYFLNEFWQFFLGTTSTIHIELLFRNAPVKSSCTDFSLVWFAGPLLK